MGGGGAAGGGGGAKKMLSVKGETVDSQPRSPLKNVAALLKLERL